MSALRTIFLVGLVVLAVICGIRGQKRSAVADLESLVADNSYGNQESSNYVGLADTLKRLQELQKFYSHQGRTRYGRSVPEADPSQTDALKSLQEAQAWFRQRRSAA